MFRITNTTSRFNLNRRLCLETLIEARPEITYTKQKVKDSKRRFWSLKWKLLEPAKATALIYASGLVVVIGPRSIDDANAVASHVFHELDGEGDFEVQLTNIAATGTLGHKVDIAKVARYAHLIATILSTSSHVSYHQEIFPGIIFSSIGFGKAKILCYHTGNFNITGLKTIKEHSDFIDEFKDYITLANEIN